MIKKSKVAPSPKLWSVGDKSQKLKHAGQILILAVIFLAVVRILAASLFGRVADFVRFGSNQILKEQAVNLAEAGVDKPLWQLNQTAGSYTGEADTTMGTVGTFSLTVSDINATNKTITSTGFVPNSQSPRAKKTIKVKATVTTTTVSFHYGVQVGSYGLRMEENSKVIGNVYSNGSIEGDNGATITQDAYVAGGVFSTPDQENSTQETEFAFANTSSREDVAQSFAPATTNPVSKVSLYIKKNGDPDDARVQIRNDNGGVPDKAKLAEGTLKGKKVTTSFGWIDVSFGSNPNLTAGTVYWLVIDAPKTSAGNYWIWGASSNAAYLAGEGKYSPDANAKNPSWSAADLDFNFKLYLGGVITTIDNLEIGGEAHANTIQNSTITGTAYCQTGIGNNKPCNTSQPDPPAQDLPVSQANIDQWRQDAAAGGTISGDFNPQDDTVTLGSKKITGNLILDENGQTLIVTGTIWVQGNIDIKNNAVIKLDPSFGDSSAVIVADGWIHLDNNGTFEGSGQTGSYILLLSTSNCLGSPDGGNCTHHDAAIDVHNNVTSTVIYASEGLLHLHNNVALKEAVAQKMQLQQSATITYDSGLASAQFSSGPGGSWQIKRGSYKFTISP